MKAITLRSALCVSLLAATPLQAFQTSPTRETLSTFFKNHGGKIIVAGFTGLIAGAFLYPYYNEDQKPTEQIILEAEEVILEIEKTRFNEDMSFLLKRNFTNSIETVVYAEYPNHFFRYPFLSYVSQLHDYIKKTSYQIWALERRLSKENKTDENNMIELLNTRLEILKTFEKKFITLREVISNHKEYYREWSEQQSTDWVIQNTIFHSFNK
jgi:hypothetical protein